MIYVNMKISGMYGTNKMVGGFRVTTADARLRDPSGGVI